MRMRVCFCKNINCCMKRCFYYQLFYYVFLKQIILHYCLRLNSPSSILPVEGTGCNCNLLSGLSISLLNLIILNISDHKCRRRITRPSDKLVNIRLVDMLRSELMLASRIACRAVLLHFWPLLHFCTLSALAALLGGSFPYLSSLSDNVNTIPWTQCDHCYVAPLTFLRSS